MKTSSPDQIYSVNKLRRAAGRPRKSIAAGVIGVATAMSMAACSAFGGKAAEEPAFRVVVEDGDFQIRDYDGYAVAETMVPRDFDSASRVGFRWLVRYISGANEGKRKIKMTAPVELQPCGEKIAMTAPVLLSPAEDSDAASSSTLAGDDIRSWSMAFVLPEGYTKETAPTPTNPMVKIRDVAPRRVASARFGGLWRDRIAEEHRTKLAVWLDERGLEHEGDWRVAGYNPPWTIPPLRRNEVLVTLR
ncbi:MAG: heme-binding protein [Gammaproteobacteria bacterium]|nr:heme-binding protein [Gammaproteobacteria bacterium]MYD01031.1 heme-binding protein [Gammaproteobacteria bacterium]MYI23961.1 heme-binding protein [Gammaproteobacteria bacterium]